MIQQYSKLNRTLRTLTKRCTDGLEAHEYAENAEVLIAEYIRMDLRELRCSWPDGASNDALLKAETTISRDYTRDTFRQIRDEFLPEMAEAIEDQFAATQLEAARSEFVDLLHPTVIANAFSQFRTGHYRDAAANAVTAVFDLIRDRTKLSLDGSDLVGRAFSMSDPYLIVSSLDTDSGQNQQKGFMQLLMGTYQALRNPSAHTLRVAIARHDAAYQLVLASFLAKKVDECTLVKSP